MLGIYKPGQGYWVRMLSAVFWGALVLAAAAWAARQAEAVRLPAKSYSMELTTVEGDVAAGSVVTLLADDPTADPAQGPVLRPLGTAVVDSVRPHADRRVALSLSGFSSADTRDAAADTQTIVLGSDESPAYRGQVDLRATSAVPVVPRIYLMGGVAGLIILIGFIALYIFVASGRKSGDFLIATDSEMRKVNWSTSKQIRAHTIVVIVATFLIAGILFGIDSAFSVFFREIGVLQTK